MITCIAVLTCFLLAEQKSFANAPGSNKPIDISITFAGNTATEKSFAWITKSNEPAPAVVVVWETDSLPITFTGKSEILSGRRVNKVTATGLKPNTKYMYRCGDGNSANWSDTFTFVTGFDKEDGTTFSFLYMTDAQCATDQQFELWQKCAKHAYAAFPNAKFVAVTGDLTDRGSDEELWDKFFYYGRNLLSYVTVVPAIGNHETDMGPGYFEDHFFFSGNHAGLPDYVYSFDYGEAHFMVLSTEKKYSDFTSADQSVVDEAYQFLDSQLNWLRYEVTKSKKKWNIVLIHKAIYTNGKYVNSEATHFYRSKLAPVFDELSIDAVLQGHNHVFDRGFIYRGNPVFGLIPSQTAVNKEQGTLYLTNNTSGAKFYEIVKGFNNPLLLKSAQPHVQLYTGVTVSEPYIRFETYTVSDQGPDILYDTFTIYK